MDVYTLIATIGPGLAEGLAVTGTTLGIASATASGIPALAEDPRLRGKVFILAFLPMTQTLVYGLTFMFLSYYLILPSIIAKYNGAIPAHIAGAIFGISLYVGFAELFSAWMQGKVCSQTAAQLVKTRGAIHGTGMILAIYEELFGVLGMVFGIVMMFLFATW